MAKRQGNNPNRRIEPLGSVRKEALEALARAARYQGSGHHKSNPADYGLERVSPRPQKTLCDGSGTVRLEEARALLAAGFAAGMVSRIDEGGWPKYVWAVDERGRPYEAKSGHTDPGAYHGYPLDPDDKMHEVVLTAWKTRARPS